MRELRIVRHSLARSVTPTAQVVPKKGEEYWVCDDWDELQVAVEAGVPFIAHRIVGMEPFQTIINPAHVVAVHQAAA